MDGISMLELIGRKECELEVARRALATERARCAELERAVEELRTALAERPDPEDDR